MPDRDPIETLQQSLDRPGNRNKPQAQIEQQCRFFWGLLKASRGQYYTAQLATATQAALSTIGAPWDQTEHEMFLTILSTGGHMTYDQDMYPVASSRSI